MGRLPKGSKVAERKTVRLSPDLVEAVAKTLEKGDRNVTTFTAAIEEGLRLWMADKRSVQHILKDLNNLTPQELTKIASKALALAEKRACKDI